MTDEELHRKVKKYLRIILTCYLVLVITIWLFSFIIEGGPWLGKIVDYETGEPLENAVVVAIWDRTVPGIGDSVDYFHKAKEAVTDSGGNFKINSYVPINFFPLITSINKPEFVIFKPGYLNIRRAGGRYFTLGSKDKPIEFSSGDSTLKPYNYKGRFSANKIELSKLKDVKSRKSILSFVISPSVPKKNIPHFTNLYNEERSYLFLERKRNKILSDGKSLTSSARKATASSSLPDSGAIKKGEEGVGKGGLGN